MIDQPHTPSRRRSPLAWLATATVVLLVAWFASDTVRAAWRELTQSGLQVSWGWLAVSGGVYVLALTPMAWYWRRVVAAIDQPVGWRPLLAAYYAGHLGKYVPGKAMVVVIRTAMLRRHGGQTGKLAASVVVETLTLMATGAAIATVLLATTYPPAGQSLWLLAAAVGMAIVAATPTLPPVLRRLVTRLAKEDPAPPRLSWRLLGAGWAAALLTWCGIAGSLWLAVVACGGKTAFDTPTALAMLLAATLPYVAGFLSLIPGGFFVRDALVMQLLAPTVGEGPALAAAAGVRLAWILAEIALYGILKVASPRAETPPPAVKAASSDQPLEAAATPPQDQPTAPAEP